MQKWQRLIRFEDESGQIHFGEPRTVSDTDFAEGRFKTANLIEGDIFSGGNVTETIVPVKKVLAPIIPPDFIGIGVNYRRLAEFLKIPIPENPIIFRKGSNGMQNPFDPIVIPKVARDPPEVDYECELGVVIGKDCKNVIEADALDYVLGYTCVNDVSARLWQNKNSGQLCYSKGFDTFLPFGPVIVASRLVPDPNNLRIATVLNGKTVQDANTSGMIFTVRRIISFLSQGATLPKGTIIFTGTPEGCGVMMNPQRFLKAGDAVMIEIEGLGRLTNHVIDEQ